MKKSLLLFLLLLLSSYAPAWATPSTIIRIPSTDVQPYGTIHLGIDNNTTMFRDIDQGGEADPVTIGFTAGMMESSFLQIEVGVDAREPTNDPVYFNAKVAVPEGSMIPALVIGAYDVGVDQSSTDFNILYAEVAKTVSFIGRFTIGYFMGDSGRLKDKDGNRDNEGLLIGFDRRMPEINERLWFGIDYQDTKSVYGATSFGFAWAFSESSSVLVGYVITKSKELSGENRVTLQSDFEF